MDNLRFGIEWDIDEQTLDRSMANSKKSIEGVGQTADKVVERVTSNVNKLAAASGSQEGVLERLKRRYTELQHQADKATNVQQVAALNREMRLYEQEIVRMTRAGKSGFDNFGRAMHDQEGILQRLQRAAALYQRGMMEATRPETLEKYSQKLEQVNAQITRLSRGGAVGSASGWNGLQNSINQISRELPAFTVSAQMGFLAISNNLPILADEIQRVRRANEELVKSGKTGVPVWRQIVSSLLSWQTAMSIGITLLVVYGRQIGNWVSSLFKGKESLDAAAASVKSFHEALKGSEFQNAVKQLDELRIGVKLAKEGIVSKKEIVDLYNKTLGDTAGKVKTLDEVEQFMVTNADNYIKMTLYKAAAQLQLAEAAKKAAEIQENSAKQSDEFATKGDDFLAILRTGGLARAWNRVSGGDNAFYDTEIETAGERRKREIEKQLQDEQEAYTKNADELMRKAADYANKMGALLFGGSIEPIKNATKAELKKYQEFLDKIVDLDQEYARKYMESDEVERLALRDKFADLRSAIEEFNNDPKNRIKIDVAALDSVESRAYENLVNDQAIANVRGQIEGYESLEEKIRAVSAELKTLNEIPESELSGSQQKALRDWTKFLEGLSKQKMDQDKKALDDLLRLYQTFEDKRLDIIKKGEEAASKLRAAGNEAQAQEAERKTNQELIDLYKGQIEESSLFKNLERDIDKGGSVAAIKALKKGREIISTMINGMKEASNSQKAELHRMFGEWFDDMEITLQLQKYDQIAHLVDGFGSLVDHALKFDGTMGTALKTIGSMTKQLGQMSQTLSSVLKDTGGSLSKAGGIASIIGAVLSIFGSIWEAMDQVHEKKQKEFEERYRYMEDFRIKQLSLQLEILQKQLDLVADIYGVDRIVAYRDVIAGINEEQERMLKIQRAPASRPHPDEYINAGRYKILQNTGIKELDELIAQYNKSLTNTDKTSGSSDMSVRTSTNEPTIIDRINEAAIKAGVSVQNLDVDLRNLTDNEALRIQAMIDTGSFDESTQKFLQTILDLREAEKQAIKAFKEEITGSGFESVLSDTLSLFFNSGRDSGDAWAEGFDKVMNDYLMQRFSREFLEVQMQEWYDMFHDLAEDGLTESEKDYLRSERDRIRIEGDRRLAEMRDLTGIESVSSTQNQVGRINRNIEETTASQILGFERARYDLAVKMDAVVHASLEFDKKAHEISLEMLRHQAAIEQNTGDGVIELRSAVKELKEITKNTSPSKARDNGYG